MPDTAATLAGSPVRVRYTRRSPGERLCDAVQRLAGSESRLAARSERPWASITFSGSRHTITLQFAGDRAVAAGEAFIAALPDHEFAIPGQLVADAAIASVDHTLLPAPRLTVCCELLLLEEA